jgi:hypothetical protein
LRVNEVRGLKPQDYNPRTGRLMVMRSDPDATTRKNRFLHNVELRPLHRRVMSEVIHRRADFRPRQGNHKGKSAGQIFQWSENYVAGFMKRIREHLGDDRDVYFPPRTAFHAYRHLGATAIAETPKKNMFDVQRALGDKSAAQAMKYCGNVGVGSVSSGVDMGDRVFHNALEDFGTPPLPEGGDASGEGGSQQLFALLTHRTKGPTGPESQ